LLGVERRAFACCEAAASESACFRSSWRSLNLIVVIRGTSSRMGLRKTRKTVKAKSTQAKPGALFTASSARSATTVT
jgi:hypothetical protein